MAFGRRPIASRLMGTVPSRLQCGKRLAVELPACMLANPPPSTPVPWHPRPCQRQTWQRGPFLRFFQHGARHDAQIAPASCIQVRLASTAVSSKASKSGSPRWPPRTAKAGCCKKSCSNVPLPGRVGRRRVQWKTRRRLEGCVVVGRVQVASCSSKHLLRSHVLS